MGDPPFPLWRPVDPDQAASPAPVLAPDRSHLPVTFQETIEIYLWGLRNGIPQTAIDDTEVWVLAELLNDTPRGADGTVEVTAEEFARRSAAEAAARAAAYDPAEMSERLAAMRGMVPEVEG